MHIASIQMYSPLCCETREDTRTRMVRNRFGLEKAAEDHVQPVTPALKEVGLLIIPDMGDGPDGVPSD